MYGKRLKLIKDRASGRAGVKAGFFSMLFLKSVFILPIFFNQHLEPSKDKKLCNNIFLYTSPITAPQPFNNEKHLRVLLYMMIPNLHELLLPVVNVGEVVNHLASLDLQPLGVRSIYREWRAREK